MKSLKKLSRKKCQKWEINSLMNMKELLEIKELFLFNAIYKICLLDIQEHL